MRAIRTYYLEPCEADRLKFTLKEAYATFNIGYDDGSADDTRFSFTLDEVPDDLFWKIIDCVKNKDTQTLGDRLRVIADAADTLRVR